MSYTANSNKQFSYSLSVILSLLFFIMAFNNGLAIYHGDTTLAWWQFRLIVIGAGYACTVICALLTVIKLKSEKSGIALRDLLAFFIPTVYYFILFISYRDGDASFFLLLFLRTLGLGLFIIADKDCKLRTFQLYRKCIVVMALLGIVVYAAQLIPLPLPHRVVPYYSLVGAGDYYDYYLGYVYKSLTGFTRLCGLFNEPGYFGTILAFVLCADGMNLRKKENIVLLIAGCLTFSFAFFALLLIHLILASYKKPKLMAFLIILVLLMVYVVPNIQLSNNDVAKLISRFYSLETSLESRTRSSFDTLFERWKTSDKVLFGYGHGYGKSIDPDGSSSYKSYFVDYGVAGFILMFAPLLIYAFRKAKGNSKCVFFVVLFIASIYQRPNIYSILYFVILFGGLEYIATVQPEADIVSKVSLSEKRHGFRIKLKG